MPRTYLSISVNMEHFDLSKQAQNFSLFLLFTIYKINIDNIIIIYNKTGTILGLMAPQRCQSCQIHQNCVLLGWS
jgi:hypothetical protein